MLRNRFRELLADLRAASVAQRRLRLAVLAGPIVAVLAGAAAADHLLVPVLVLVALLAACCALQPDSNIGLLVTVAVAWHWAGAVHHHRTPWVLPAAAGLLVFHAAAALASTAPTRATWSPVTLSRWARRVAVVAGMTAAAWVLMLGIDAIDVHGGAVLLVAATVVLGAGALALRARSAGAPPA